MEREKRKRYTIWSFFTKKEPFVATCNTCNNDYSYRSSVSNLRKHWEQKHGKPNDLTDHSNSDTSDGEPDSFFAKKRPNPTWKYFDILDSDKFVANCKLCGSDIQYDTVADLTKHVQEHGEKMSDSDEDFDLQGFTEKKNNRKKSVAWTYFKDINPEQKLAACLFCRKVLSYSATVTNLKRHLIRKHPSAKLYKEEPDTKKLIISANGQIYEVETENKVEDDDEKDPIEMDTVYLDDMEDTMTEPPTPNIIPSTPKKTEILSEKLTYKRNRPKIFKEQIRNRNRRSSSEDEVPAKRRQRTMDRLDYFGQYVISLLKELPKHASDQLQGDIINQIITTKVNLDAQDSTNYTLAVRESNLNQSNQSIAEPVTVSFNKNVEGSSNNSNNAMLVESTENTESN